MGHKSMQRLERLINMRVPRTWQSSFVKMSSQMLNRQAVSARAFGRAAGRSRSSVRVMASAKPLTFSKYQGLGNDFILVSSL